MVELTIVPIPREAKRLVNEKRVSAVDKMRVNELAPVTHPVERCAVPCAVCGPAKHFYTYSPERPDGTKRERGTVAPDQTKTATLIGLDSKRNLARDNMHHAPVHASAYTRKGVVLTTDEVHGAWVMPTRPTVTPRDIPVTRCAFGASGYDPK
jgi:hypothetical protein